jgi:hypothetical protein
MAALDPEPDVQFIYMAPLKRTHKTGPDLSSLLIEKPRMVRNCWTGLYGLVT